MEKQFRVPINWVGQDLEISKEGQTVLDRLMESQVWHKLASSVGGGFRKGHWPLLTLMPDILVSPCLPLVPFKLLLQCWSSEGVSLSVYVWVL